MLFAAGVVAAAVLGSFGPATAEAGPAPDPSARHRAYLPVVFAQSTLAPRLVGWFGGASTTVAVPGRYAYVREGVRLVVLDLADRRAPVAVAGVAFSTDVAHIVLEGDRAYVVADGVHILDVRDPLVPRRIGHFGRSGFIVVDDGLAYVGEHGAALSGTGAPGLAVYDVADAAAVRELGRLAHPVACSMAGFFIRQLVVDDGVATMPSTNGLYRVDVHDPTRPWHIICDFDHYGRFLLTGRKGVGVVYGNRSLTVVDTRDAGEFRDRATFEVCTGESQTITIARATQRYVYAVCEHNGASTLHVVDIGEASAPRRKGSVALPLVGPRMVYGEDMVVAGQTLYLANAGESLVVVDVEKSATPRIEGVYASVQSVQRVVADGDLLYALDRDAFPGRLRVMRVETAGPRVVGSATLPGTGSVVVVDGGVAYVAGSYEVYGSGAGAPGYLSLFDVARPELPVEIAHVDLPAAPIDLALSDGVVYLVAGRDRLVVIDVRDLAYPRVVFDEPRGIDLGGVRVAGGHLFLADRGSGWNRDTEGSGLRVLDATTPALAEIGLLRLPDVAALEVEGERVILRGRSGGLAVVDVRDPARPALVSQDRQTVYGYADPPVFAVSGDYVFLAGDGPLRIVDVSRPGIQTEMARLDARVLAGDLAVVGDRLYAAAGTSGLAMVDWRGGAQHGP